MRELARRDPCPGGGDIRSAKSNARATSMNPFAEASIRAVVPVVGPPVDGRAAIEQLPHQSPRLPLADAHISGVKTAPVCGVYRGALGEQCLGPREISELSPTRAGRRPRRRSGRRWPPGSTETGEHEGKV